MSGLGLLIALAIPSLTLALWVAWQEHQNPPSDREHARSMAALRRATRHGQW